ncbi:hypothetical protein HDU97_010037 [Phlyctochytrium planicorne]|nr:hypothetical protein HDU97_010037 [Phlyctochytrium planicorne]
MSAITIITTKTRGNSLNTVPNDGPGSEISSTKPVAPSEVTTAPPTTPNPTSPPSPPTSPLTSPSPQPKLPPNLVNPQQQQPSPPVESVDSATSSVIAEPSTVTLTSIAGDPRQPQQQPTGTRVLGIPNGSSSISSGQTVIPTVVPSSQQSQPPADTAGNVRLMIAVAGGTVVGLVAIALIVLFVCLHRRRQQRKQKELEELEDDSLSTAGTFTFTPKKPCFFSRAAWTNTKEGDVPPNSKGSSSQDPYYADPSASDQRPHDGKSTPTTTMHNQNQDLMTFQKYLQAQEEFDNVSVNSLEPDIDKLSVRSRSFFGWGAPSARRMSSRASAVPWFNRPKRNATQNSVDTLVAEYMNGAENLDRKDSGATLVAGVSGGVDNRQSVITLANATAAAANGAGEPSTSTSRRFSYCEGDDGGVNGAVLRQIDEDVGSPSTLTGPFVPDVFRSSSGSTQGTANEPIAPKRYESTQQANDSQQQQQQQS